MNPGIYSGMGDPGGSVDPIDTSAPSEDDTGETNDSHWEREINEAFPAVPGVKDRDWDDESPW